MMIERDLEIVFNTRVVSDTYLMGLRSKEIAGAANPGHFVMIRVRSGIDP
jgi:NAD(P)H-flavin reductase